VEYSNQRRAFRNNICASEKDIIDSCSGRNCSNLMECLIKLLPRDLLEKVYLDEQLMTPLQLAILHNSQNVVRLLLGMKPPLSNLNSHIHRKGDTHLITGVCSCIVVFSCEVTFFNRNYILNTSVCELFGKTWFCMEVKEFTSTIWVLKPCIFGLLFLT